MEINNKGLLELVFYCDDLDRTLSIREYLKELLRKLWKEGEGFSGKRPFGNSGWEWDVAKPLIRFGVINGALDEDDYIEDIDTKAFNKLILELIDEL